MKTKKQGSRQKARALQAVREGVRKPANPANYDQGKPKPGDKRMRRHFA